MKLKTLLPTITGSLLGLLPLNLEAQQTLYKKEHKPSKTTVEISGSKELSNTLEYEILIKSNNFSPEERLIRPQISDTVVVFAVPEEMNIDYNSIKTERWDFKSKSFVEIKSDSQKVRDLETGLLENLIQTKLPFFSLGIKSFEEQKREDIADAQEKLPEWAKDPNKVDYLPIYINTQAGADAGKDVVKIRFSLNLEDKISNMELPAVIAHNYYGPEMFENINPKVATHVISDVNHYYKQFGKDSKDTLEKKRSTTADSFYWYIMNCNPEKRKALEEKDRNAIDNFLNAGDDNLYSIIKKARSLIKDDASLEAIDSFRKETFNLLDYYVNFGEIIANENGKPYGGLIIFPLKTDSYDITSYPTPESIFFEKGGLTLKFGDGEKMEIERESGKSPIIMKLYLYKFNSDQSYSLYGGSTETTENFKRINLHPR